MLLCSLLAGAEAPGESTPTVQTWTARELVDNIIESERKIRNWEVRAEYTHSNGYKVVYEMGWDPPKKYQQGTSFTPAGKRWVLGGPPGQGPVDCPASTTNFTYVFDGTKSYRLEGVTRSTVRAGKVEQVEHRDKDGSIGPGDHSLTFRNWGPHELLGYWVGAGFRGCEGKTLGEVLLRHIDKVRIRKAPEAINGHLCMVMEVLGISKCAPKGLDVPDELRFWIDTERDFRPLRITTYRVRYRDRASPQKELSSTFEITKLTKVDGIWFPIECKGDDTVVRIETESIRLNKNVDPSRFAPIDFPPGCRFSDLFTDEHYIVGEFSDPAYEPKTPLEKLLKELRDRQVEVDRKFTKGLIGVLRDFNVFDDKEKWTAAVRGLVLIGRAAVPELIAELKRTKNPNTVRAIAFTLRAIGDSAAVDALIDALDHPDYGPTSSCGLGPPKTNLDRFIKRHQSVTSDPKLGFQGWQYEVTVALEKLTGHTEGHKHLWPHDSKGNPIPCNKMSSTIAQPMEKPRTVARRWRQWWNQNKHRFVSQNRLKR
jgi:hypothetical protein